MNGPLDRRARALLASLPPQTIALYVSEDSSAMEVAAIASVFAQANRLDGRLLYQPVLVGAAEGSLLVDGLPLMPLSPQQLSAGVDTLVLTGRAPASREALPLRCWLLTQLQQARRSCAVAGGVLALAELGPALCRRVAARPGTTALLAAQGSGLQADEQVLYLRDGALWSCPGGASVLDMCLAMVEDDCGRRLANAVAAHLLLPGRRSSGNPQLSPLLMAQSRGGRDRELAQLLDWLNENAHQRLDVAALAARVHMSERNFHRRFKEYTGYPPLEYLKQLRLERARQLLMCDLSLKEVADHTGFASPTMVRRALRSAEA
jgi:transcriptional regulator GlxA family with amidase domain